MRLICSVEESLSDHILSAIGDGRVQQSPEADERSSTTMPPVPVDSVSSPMPTSRIRELTE